MAKRLPSKPSVPDRVAVRRSGGSRAIPDQRRAPAVPATAGSKSPAAGPRVVPAAVAAFERAVRAMQAHEFASAADQFRVLLADGSAEAGLRDRADVYLALCERELRRRPAAPVTAEERLTAATAALNNGDDDAAERLARQVLGEYPEQDLALYLLAAIEARRGAAHSALHMLTLAVRARPDIRAQARHDDDFAALRSLEAFQELIDVRHLPADPTGRPPRRTR